jgi:hypothetical protein
MVRRCRFFEMAEILATHTVLPCKHRKGAECLESTCAASQAGFNDMRHALWQSSLECCTRTSQCTSRMQVLRPTHTPRCPSSPALERVPSSHLIMLSWALQGSITVHAVHAVLHAVDCRALACVWLRKGLPTAPQSMTACTVLYVVAQCCRSRVLPWRVCTALHCTVPMVVQELSS